MSTVLETPKAAISSAQALKIAEIDAAQAYGDLTPYEIRINWEPDGWHIDYELRNRRLHGGGPHYVIDATTGRIAKKRYEQ
jgi:hypothetical protein